MAEKPSYGAEFAVTWLMCSICGMTDKDVAGSPAVHPNVQTCMNKVQGLPLHTASTADVAHYTGREPNYYPLDASERSAIEEAVEAYRRTHLEERSPEYDMDGS